MSINNVGALGNTHLMMATMNNYVNVVKMLLDAGADPFICNDSGQTAMDIAIDSSNQEIYNLLIEATERYSNPPEHILSRVKYRANLAFNSILRRLEVIPFIN